MLGQIIGHYTIESKLGEGGMGVVYKATDAKLDRTVALKFLPDRVSKDAEAKARFLQEARAAAGLNHPNICTVHGVEDIDGQLFMVMELVEGGSLSDKIPFGDMDDAITTASQIAHALQKAHEKGIVHRDVKADNIMLSADGQAKVMDFGLAKLKGALKLTRTSSTVGTLGYMAPEQIQGGEVDHRSDVFSFGVLLFEMLTGKLPFRGEHEAAMVYSIVNEEPQDIMALKPDLSPIIANLIHRCLEKDPSERYQHFDDIIADLKRSQKKTSRVLRSSAAIAAASAPGSDGPGVPAARSSSSTSRLLSGKSRLYVMGVIIILLGAAVLVLTNPFASDSTGPEGKTRLVVLPFQNKGPAEQDYFVDGITEEIIGRLSRLSGLSVIARSSAMKYKGTDKTLKEIGEELGVSYVLLGTVRWSQQPGSEDRLRVNPELVRIDDATQVWSEPFEAAFSGGFELQARIASQVATALGVSLAASEHKNLETPLTENAEAYRLYLKGNDYVQRGVEDKVAYGFGEQMYKQAIELDPAFAAAWAALSKLHTDMHWFHWDLSEKRLDDGRVAAEKALQLDPTLAASHAAMGAYYYHGLLDYEPALKNFREALAIDPNSSEALLGVGSVLRRQGKMEEALPYFEKVAANDPRSAGASLELGYTQECLRRYADASRSYDRSITLAPDEAVYYVYAVNNLMDWKGDVVGARRILATAAERKVPDHNHELDNTAAIVAFKNRDYQEALRILQTSGPLVLDNQNYYTPAPLLKGMIMRSATTGDPAAQFTSAKTALEQRINEFPDDSRLYTSLGIALAGLGRKEEAVKKAKEGVSILPMTKEALRGANREYELAVVYALIGEQIRALDQLEQIPPFSNVVVSGDLKLNPVWDSLRGLPRFRKLLASLEPKD